MDRSINKHTVDADRHSGDRAGERAPRVHSQRHAAARIMVDIVLDSWTAATTDFLLRTGCDNAIYARFAGQRCLERNKFFVRCRGPRVSHR